MKKNKNLFIPVAKPTVGIQEAHLAYEQIRSNWITMGKKVKEFENKVCKFLNVRYAIAMNNGTSTLDALLTALNISSKDEVIIPSLTYISTANVVMYKGAKLVLCDSNLETFNINPDSVLKKITKKTKLIIVTDLKGMPVEYDFFKKLSKKTKIPIISDSAESFGAKYKNKYVGSQLLAHSFSFFANKNITTGEGGMIVTNNRTLARKLAIIRNQGQNKRYNHVLLGNNYRMTDICATIGICQLNKLRTMIKKKEKIAKIYDQKLSKIKEIQIPYIPKNVTQHGWYNYTIRVPAKLRNKLIKFLEKRKIETRLSFPPVHIQPYYKKNFKYKKNFMPEAYKSYTQFLDLPIWPNLSQKELSIIINSISIFFK